LNLAKQKWKSVKGRIEEHRWDEIYGLERHDSTVGPILLALKRNYRPSLNRVYGMEPPLKKLAIQWERLKLHYGVLFHCT
jgi:hypothetical protein